MVGFWKETQLDEFWVRIQRWNLSLDLIRMCCYRGQWVIAMEELGRMEKLDMVTQQVGRKEIPFIPKLDKVDLGIGKIGNKGPKLLGAREKTLRWLAVRRKWEEGLLYLEKGRNAEEANENNNAEVTSCWESAKNALHVAELGQVLKVPERHTKRPLRRLKRIMGATANEHGTWTAG